MSETQLDKNLLKDILKILIINKDTSFTREELYNTLLIQNKYISNCKKEYDKIFENIDNYNNNIKRIYIYNKEYLTWKLEESKVNVNTVDQYINDIKNGKIKVNDYINELDTIIHYLTKKEDLKSLKELEDIASNIDWLKKNKNGKSCMDIAKDKKNLEIYDYLNEKKYKKLEEYYERKYNYRIYLLFFILGVLTMMDTNIKILVNNYLLRMNTTIYEKVMYNNTTNIILSTVRNLFNLMISITRYILNIEIINDLVWYIYF